MAIKLARSGHSFVVLEKAARIGGTWRENTYPGAGCDLPSHLYSFSFHPGQWSRRYGTQAEILAYLEELAETYHLGPHLRLGAEVDSAEFVEPPGEWRLRLAGGARLTAGAVVSSVGQLSRPALPPIPGRERFCGRSWHSARWDHGFELDGQRIAVIGTGASVIQFVPEIASRAARVHVFQRSAPYVVPKPDRAYGPMERRLFARVPLLRLAARLRIFLKGELLGAALVASPGLRRLLTARWRSFMRKEIEDTELRARCTPDYVVGCKRILFSNDWYATLKRPEVELVTESIASITETGVATEDGASWDVDAIIYGTGFQASGFLQPMRVLGRGGRDLHEGWRDGAHAYRGVAVAGFPNFFMLFGPNTSLGSNSIIYMLEAQIGYIARALETLRRRRLRWLDVRRDIQDEFNRWIAERSQRTVWETGCHSWYTTGGRNTANWPTYPFRYRRQLRRFDLSDYVTR
jgi:cation diffusion facilitator CzcD-associated flavoprotein CzcO